MSYTTELYLEHRLIQDSCLLHGDDYRDDCEICQDIVDTLVSTADDEQTFSLTDAPFYEDAYVIIQ